VRDVSKELRGGKNVGGERERETPHLQMLKMVKQEVEDSQPNRGGKEY